jgi:hypothetical protein
MEYDLRAKQMAEIEEFEETGGGNKLEILLNQIAELSESLRAEIISQAEPERTETVEESQSSKRDKAQRKKVLSNPGPLTRSTGEERGKEV